MSISIKQIRYFLAVAETGQITLAATSLNVSQSAITTSIKNLEDYLGAKLFDRHAQGLSLTYEGNQFLYRANNVMIAVQEAIQFPKLKSNNLTGKLRLAVTYTISGYFIPTYLARFKRDFPNIEISLTEVPRGEIEVGLIQEKFDIAVLLSSNIVNRTEISTELLERSRRRLWVPAAHELISEPEISLRKIASEPYIMLTVDEANETTDKYWEETPYRPNVFFNTNSVEAVRSLVASGMGVTILSDMVYRSWSLEGLRIIALPILDHIPTMDTGLAWKTKVDLSEPTSTFKDFMTYNLTNVSINNINNAD